MSGDVLGLLYVPLSIEFMAYIQYNARTLIWKKLREYDTKNLKEHITTTYYYISVTYILWRTP